ncbi:MAG: hypothetical protein HOP11_02435, partial [Saprospiraceae bacterium]|nr:hypothetical protein [Saprospiraceae bacterium]
MKDLSLRIFPESAYLDLEFDRVLELTASLAVGDDAKDTIRKIVSSVALSEILEKINRLEEFNYLLRHSRVQLSEYHNVSIELRNLGIENFILSAEEVLKIYDVLINLDQIKSAILAVPDSNFTYLNSDLSKLPDVSDIISKIRKIFDKDQNIRDEATEELSSIRKKIRSKNSEIYRTFKSIVNNLKTSGLLAEEEEGIRNGKLVVRLLAEHRRKIQGIVHDRSEGGRTVYVEPQEIVELNNELFELHADEKTEIQKILFNLCKSMRPYAASLGEAYSQLVEWDVLGAKSHLAEMMLAIKPDVRENQKMSFKNARHPLFYLRLKEQKKEIVPFSFYLNEKNRIMLISGPNAGGKSVTLKSVGLIQLMLQAGFFVPVDKTSEFTVFRTFMVDIGDHQSIEDELSTYSARLSNMRKFVENADEKTMILIDEFGSGTEPQIGGAIAESVLKVLGEKNSMAVINTHYSNLKAFAHKHEGYVNAAMIFDEKNLAPTYQLSVGRPGSSYALEIANKVKLPKEILDYAKKKIGDQAVSFENLLASLDKEINTLKKQVEDYQNKQIELDRLIQSYNQINKQFEYKRLKLRLEQKQFEVLIKSNKQKEINAYIEEIQKLKSLEGLEKKAESKRKELEI